MSKAIRNLNEINNRLNNSLRKLLKYDVIKNTFKKRFTFKQIFIILIVILLVFVPEIFNVFFRASFHCDYMDYLEYLASLFSAIIAVLIAESQFHKNSISMLISSVSSNLNRVMNSFMVIHKYSYILYDDVHMENRFAFTLKAKYVGRTIKDDKKFYSKIEYNILNSLTNIGFDNRLNSLIYNVINDSLSLLIMFHLSVMRFSIDDNKEFIDDEKIAENSITYLQSTSKQFISIIKQIQRKNNDELKNKCY